MREKKERVKDINKMIIDVIDTKIQAFRVCDDEDNTIEFSPLIAVNARLKEVKDANSIYEIEEK